VRSFGEQVLHVADDNVKLPKLLGAPVTAPTIDLAATKASIVARGPSASARRLDRGDVDLLIVIIALIARLAAARSGSCIASIKARGVICQLRPNRSLHQPQALSWPPLPTIAFQ